MQKWNYTYYSPYDGFVVYLASRTLALHETDELTDATLVLEKPIRHFETAGAIVALLNQLLDFGIMDIGYNPKDR